MINRKYMLTAIILNIILMVAIIGLFGVNFILDLAIGKAFLFSAQITTILSIALFLLVLICAVPSIIFSALSIKLINASDEIYYKNKKLIEILGLFNGVIIGYLLSMLFMYFNIWFVVILVLVLGVTLLFFIDYDKVKKLIDNERKQESLFDSDNIKK